MFALWNIIVALLLGLIVGIMMVMLNANEEAFERAINIVGNLYQLFILLPALGVTVRRLHDTGRSGWWILIALVPIIGAIALLIFFVQDSDPGTNRFGPPPKTNYPDVPDEYLRNSSAAR